MAILGTGNRGGRVFDSSPATKTAIPRGCGGEPGPLGQWMTPSRQTYKLDTVGDYRRILDRKDIDAILIATPDHCTARS